LVKPFVLVMFALAAVSLFRPLVQDIRAHAPKITGPRSGARYSRVWYFRIWPEFWYGLKDVWSGLKVMVTNLGTAQYSIGNLFSAALLILFVVMLSQSFDWPFAARIVPTIVGVGAILFCSLSLINDVFGLHERDGAGATGIGGKTHKIHMDIASKTAHLPGKIVLTRGFFFFGWMAGFMVVMALIGLIPAVPVFIIAYMRIEGREPLKIVIPMAAAVVALIYVVFDQLLAIPWPPTLAGTLFPALKAIPSV
jgi:hypothetical protein